MTSTKKNVVDRHAPMLAASPATPVMTARSRGVDRWPLGNTSHAERTSTSAVARANPLNTLEPTAAE